MAVTTLDRQTSHRFPSFLPDGRHFLFYAQGTPDTAGIYLGSLDAPDTHRLTAADTAGVYLSRRPGPPGREVAGSCGCARGRSWPSAWTWTRQALTGDPVTLADPVAFDATLNAGAVSVSASGLVAYRTGGASRRQLTWFDRSGKALGTLGAPDENGLLYPSVSPDGRRVAVSRTVQGNTDIWLLDGTRTSRFTFDAALDRFPIWSPDGSRIVFDSNRKGHARPLSEAVQRRRRGGTARGIPAGQGRHDWSADGRFLSITASTRKRTATSGCCRWTATASRGCS